jgi:hypothetical protein
MSSLKKRKIQNGERPQSARAIRVEDLMQLASYYSTLDRNSLKRLRFIRNHCIYLISFFCLLRMNEGLSLKMGDIEMLPNNAGLKITLPFRKTQQAGDCKPFFLYRNDSNPAICPIRAWINYVNVLASNREARFRYYDGPVFVNINASKEVCLGNAFSYQAFMREFREDMKIAQPRDFQAYGSHSFRRGGVQYLHCFMEPASARWNLKKICNWGGKKVHRKNSVGN